MKFQKCFEPETYKSVSQLLEGITYAYDLCLGHSRDYWKLISKKYNRENFLHDTFGYVVP